MQQHSDPIEVWHQLLGTVTASSIDVLAVMYAGHRSSLHNRFRRQRQPRRQSTILEVVHRHEKLAPESGVEFMAPISGPVSGACVTGLRTAAAIQFPHFGDETTRGQCFQHQSLVSI